MPVDKHPQWLRAFVDQVSANTLVSKGININLPSGYVGNLLRVFFDVSDWSLGADDEIFWALTDRTFSSQPQWNQAGVLAMASLESHGTPGSVSIGPIKIDLHDGDGHGPLFAAEVLYFYFSSSSFASPLGGKCAVQYTTVKVSASELVALVNRS